MCHIYALFVSLCLSNICLINGANIKFYDDIDFEGFFYESQADFQDGCINLPQGKNHASSVNSNGACVILYDEDDCKGHKLKIAPGVHSHNNLEKHGFSDKTSSFSVCSAAESSEKINHPQLGLYDNNWQESLLMEYQDICQCTNLPSFVNDKVSSVNTHGNCIRLYEDKDCRGGMKELKTGDGLNHGDFNSFQFNDKTSSINVCGDMPKCRKLKAEVEKMKFAKNNLKDMLNADSPKKIELASKNTFRNNASTPITRTYEGRKTYTETYEFEKVESLSHMHSVGVDLTVGIEGGAGIPFLAEGKVKTELKTAYQFQSTSNSEKRQKYSTQNTREFSVSETFTVPPCTVYEVSSFMEVVDNLPIQYELMMRISGENHGKSLSAEELKGSLPKGVEFVEKTSGTEIRAKTKGRILANVGIKSEVESHGRKIPGCQEKRRRRSILKHNY